MNRAVELETWNLELETLNPKRKAFSTHHV